ncbi:MAG: hypothetical protein RL410_1218 [Actinomycetota bacterium]|jgi:predicted short-subunit dehydrogenase-like oxidoreductase (DUF2520 family)
MTTHHDSRLRVGIIGVGRVGTALGRALQNAGHVVVAVHAVSEQSQNRAREYFPATDITTVEALVQQSDLILLAVPDDVLEGLIAGIAQSHGFRHGQCIAHTSGRYGISVLTPAALQGALVMALHPAMTFVGVDSDIYRLNACPFAVTASDEALAIAQALVIEMGGDPHIISEVDRVRYHAALAHASNHLTTLVVQSQEMLRDVGIENAGNFLSPLVMASAENALQSGISALTGPISRGDVATVRAHIAELPTGISRDTYCALALATIEAARRGNRISAEQAAQLRAVVSP